MRTSPEVANLFATPEDQGRPPATLDPWWTGQDPWARERPPAPRQAPTQQDVANAQYATNTTAPFAHPGRVAPSITPQTAPAPSYQSPGEAPSWVDWVQAGYPDTAQGGYQPSGLWIPPTTYTYTPTRNMGPMPRDAYGIPVGTVSRNTEWFEQGCSGGAAQTETYRPGGVAPPNSGWWLLH